ncbi:MAG: hypothetical protein MHMPM18_002191, partial [Marteilia pararefringens]
MTLSETICILEVLKKEHSLRKRKLDELSIEHLQLLGNQVKLLQIAVEDSLEDESHRQLSAKEIWNCYTSCSQNRAFWSRDESKRIGNVNREIEECEEKLNEMQKASDARREKLKALKDLERSSIGFNIKLKTLEMKISESQERNLTNL